MHYPGSLAQSPHPSAPDYGVSETGYWPVPCPARRAARDSLVDAEGVILDAPGTDNRAAVQPFDHDELEGPALSLLGCDPAVVLLGPALRRYGIKLVWAEEGSYQALTGLARGEAHVAGCHLRDESTGGYNFSWVSQWVPFPCTLVTFAAWQQGLIVAGGQSLGDIQGGGPSCSRREHRQSSGRFGKPDPS